MLAESHVRIGKERAVRKRKLKWLCAPQRGRRHGDDREESQYCLIAECRRRHLPTLQRLAKLGTTWNRTRAPVGCRNYTSSMWMAANRRRRKVAPPRTNPAL